MSPSLEQAVSVALRLPESEQDHTAAKIREATAQIDDDARWQQQFADSEDVLEMLHDEGLWEYQEGTVITPLRIG